MTIELTTATASQLQGIRREIAATDIVSVKDYGAIGDAKRISGMSKASGATGVLTGAPANTFVAGDVGKVAWAVAGAGDVVGLGTITAVNSSTSVTLSGSPNAGTFSGSVYLYYATQNETTAIQSAVTAAIDQQRTIYFPPGGYFFNRQLVGRYNVDDSWDILGAGTNQTTMYVMPDHDLTVAANTTGVCFAINQTGGNSIEGFRIDSAFKSFSASGKSVIQYQALSNSSSKLRWPRLRDVIVENAKGFTSSVSIENCSYVTVDRVSSYNGGYIGINVSSCNSDVFLRNVTSSNGAGYGMSFYAAKATVEAEVDENQAASIQVDGASTVRFVNGRIYGANSVNCLEVSGSSTVILEGMDVIPFNAGYNAGAVSIASGSKVIARNCSISNRGTGKCITGAGQFIDDGGNTLTGTVDVTTAKGVAFNYPISLVTKTPSSASDAGVTGQIAWDASYIYICTATNTWKRVAISTW